MRNIKVMTTSGITGNIETNVETLGELKPLLREKGINCESMKIMIGETRHELDLDEAVLPDENFKLYLLPKKTKSGADKEDITDKIRDIAEEIERLAELLEEFSSYSNNSKSSTNISEEDQEDLRDIRSLEF